VISDKNGATPLYLVFHPIEYKERHKYKDEKNIPKALLCWQDIDAGTPRDPKKPGRNDVLVQIGQALLQGKEIKRGASSRWSFGPDSTTSPDSMTTIGKTHPTLRVLGQRTTSFFSWRSFCS